MTTKSRTGHRNRGLSGKVVLITGAANGIGAETARQLAAAGARIALLDCDKAALMQLAGELADSAAGFVADVTDADSIDAAVRAVVAHFGGIDAVLANAGISGPVATVASVDPADFEQIIHVNLLGVFRTVRAALPQLTQRRGYVLLISSIMALVPSPAAAGYAATKAGVESFGRALRVELADADVRVGIAYFGLIDTGMVRDIVSNTGFGAVLATLPGFFGKPAPVTDAAAVLVSGVARRAKRVYAPGYVRVLLDLRTVLALADPLLARHRGLAGVIRGADNSAGTQGAVMTSRMPSVAIIGAGMSGMCMAITLRRAGITDLTLYEKASEVGGTWRDNTYPGLNCDVASRFYQYTFAPNPTWSHFFSPGAEIQAYFTKVADDYGLRRNIRFDTEVVEATFAEHRWRIRTAAGEQQQVDFLITAAGVLREPRYPDIAGLDDFGGAVMHSARWDHSVATTGKRVAVIGTGSTGVQIVCGLAPTVERLTLFQRSAQWVVPFPNLPYSKVTDPLRRRLPVLGRLAYRTYRWIYELLLHAMVRPGWQRTLLGKICRVNLRTVRDPKLRAELTPDYQPMCRRLVLSAGFYRAMQRDNVDLVTDAIDHVEPRGVVTADGVLHEVDVIALATGFDAHAYMRPMRLIGRDGVTIDQAWSGGPRAHLTVAIPGFPNMFMLMGPHSPVGNYSLIAVAETQADHILGWIDRWRDEQFDSVAPTQAATDEFYAVMRAAMPGTVWTTGCTSWYLGADGLPELWPWTPARYRARLGEPPAWADFELRSGQAASI